MLEPTRVKAVELEGVAAADAEHRTAAPSRLDDLVDQPDGPCARIGLALRERALELRGEVVAVFERATPPEPAELEPVRCLPQPPCAGPQARPHTRAMEAHGAIV